MQGDFRTHWDGAYAGGDADRSWYQDEATVSLELIDAAGIGPDDAVVDVGGGASTLVDGLLDRGFVDLTVLDVSPVGLGIAHERVGARGADVVWQVADVLAWAPERTYRAWHDRAVLHFLTSESGRDAYRRVLDAATAPGSVAVMGVFGPEGPEYCSGLPVRRYSADDLAGFLGAGWAEESRSVRDHLTPSGARQQFTWCVFRRA